MPRIHAESVTAHRELMAGRLLDAVGEVLAELGYGGLSLAEVAARAGMARNSVYGYAADKEELLLAYVAREVSRFMAETRAQLEGASDPADRLRLLIRLQMAQFRTEPGAGRGARGMVQGADLGPRLHARLMDEFRPLHDLVGEIVEAGIAQGTFRPVPVDHVVPLITGCLGAQRLPVGTGQLDPDRASQVVADFVLHALGDG